MNILIVESNAKCKTLLKHLGDNDWRVLPTGGHVGFWSVRNGFALARVTSSADRLGWDPHVLYVQAQGDLGTCQM